MPRTIMPEEGFGERSENWSIRQRRLREELIREAMNLFGQKGYAETNIAEIGAVVGISHRTFFRYFRSKDDLAFGWLEDKGGQISDALAATAGQKAVDRLKIALLDHASRIDSERMVTRSLMKLIYETPALHGRFRLHQSSWENVYFRLLTDPDSTPHADFALRLQIALVDSAYSAALREWTYNQAEIGFRNFVAEAFDLLAELPDIA